MQSIEGVVLFLLLTCPLGSGVLPLYAIINIVVSHPGEFRQNSRIYAVQLVPKSKES